MVRNIVAVIVGIIVGALINSGLVELGYFVIPPPAGFDKSTFETFVATMHLFEPQNYIFPFLAHAFGTLVGTAVALLIAATHKARIVMIMGFIFLLGGIAAALMFPAPMWFIFVDLIFAYTPMAWIAGRLFGAGKTN